MKGLLRNRRLLTAACCFALATWWTVTAVPNPALAKGKPGGGGGGGKSNFKVCVVFDDLATDGVFSDGLPYCNKRNEGVLAAVGDGFRLDTTGGNRKVGFNLGEPNNDPGIGVFDGEDIGFAAVDIRIGKQYQTDEFDNLILDIDGNPKKTGNRLNVGAMEVGEIARASLSIWFEVGALTYADAYGYPDCVGSAPVKVTRTSSTTWAIQTVSPFDEDGGGDACLWGNGAGGMIFSMPFGLTIEVID